MTTAVKPADIRPEAEVNVQLFDIPLSLIDADPKKNARTVMDEAKIKEIAESMKKAGQLTPAKVEKKPNGRYDLVFGYRRRAAATMLEWPTLRCEIEKVPMDPVDRKIANIAENLAREDLTTYDQAMAFLDLKNGHDLSGIKIGQHVGKSTSYVNNLTRIAEGLDDVVLRRWKEECEPKFGQDKEGKKIAGIMQVCTMDWLTKLVANVPKADQEHEMLRAMGLVEDDEEGDEAGGDSGRSPTQPGANKRATKVELERALELAEAKQKEAKGEDKAEMRGVVMALKFAIGKNKSIKGVYTSPKPGESDE